MYIKTWLRLLHFKGNSFPEIFPESSASWASSNISWSAWQSKGEGDCDDGVRDNFKLDRKFGICMKLSSLFYSFLVSHSPAFSDRHSRRTSRFSDSHHSHCFHRFLGQNPDSVAVQIMNSWLKVRCLEVLVLVETKCALPWLAEHSRPGDRRQGIPWRFSKWRTGKIGTLFSNSKNWKNRNLAFQAPGATSVSLISKTLLNCSDMVTLTCDSSKKSRYRCSTKVT